MLNIEDFFNILSTAKDDPEFKPCLHAGTIRIEFIAADNCQLCPLAYVYYKLNNKVLDNDEVLKSKYWPEDFCMNYLDGIWYSADTSWFSMTDSVYKKMRGRMLECLQL